MEAGRLIEKRDYPRMKYNSKVIFMWEKNKTAGIIILACVTVAGAFLHFSLEKTDVVKQDNQVSSNANQDNACASESKEQCLERVDKLDEKQLLTEAVSSNNQSSTFTILQYFNCKLLGEKNEGMYADAKNFINEYVFLKEAERAYFSDWFGRVYSGEYSSEFYGFLENLALGDISKLCPYELTSMCQGIERIYEPSALKLDEVDNPCSSLCDNLARYAGSEQKELAVKTDSDYGNFASHSVNGYMLKPAIIYRFGGYGEALKICDSFPATGQKQTCEGFVSSADAQKGGCRVISDKLKKSICAKE